MKDQQQQQQYAVTFILNTCIWYLLSLLFHLIIFMALENVHLMFLYVTFCITPGSGVVVPGEVGILLIYTPNFFFTARERMNDLYHKEWRVKLDLHI